MKIFLIFPHQIFSNVDKLASVDKIVLIEDSLFFFDPKYKIKFHQQKLVLHRASLKAYQLKLESLGLNVEYLDYAPEVLKNYLKELPSNSELYFYDPVDFVLNSRLQRFSSTFNLKTIKYESLNFICTTAEISQFFQDKKRYFQTDFYKWQRQRFSILMQDDQKPLGGKLTYDLENRKKLPKNIELPATPKPNNSAFVQEAKNYITTNFSDHPGETDSFFYPVDHNQAIDWLENFLLTKFNNFGPYEDAFTMQENPLLFHSGISAILNIGLLDPMSIIKLAEASSASLSSKEGFIRQILGWREFIRAIYILEGVTQRNSNFFKHQKKLPSSFWTGTTGILPIDDIIKKLHKYAYSHHIERLMVLGNFMNLSEIDPHQVYDWFMTFYIDAYDWVMVPNVYGMTLFADGGLITTKPYISSSNYILKMSDYKKQDWCTLWDSLYWNFVDKHQQFLKKNIRFSMILSQFHKMDSTKKSNLIKTAKDYLK